MQVDEANSWRYSPKGIELRHKRGSSSLISSLSPEGLECEIGGHVARMDRVAWPGRGGFARGRKKPPHQGHWGAAAKCSIAFHRTQRQCHQHTRSKIYRWIYVAWCAAILFVRWLYPMKPGSEDETPRRRSQFPPTRCCRAVSQRGRFARRRLENTQRA